MLYPPCQILPHSLHDRRFCLIIPILRALFDYFFMFKVFIINGCQVNTRFCCYQFLQNCSTFSYCAVFPPKQHQKFTYQRICLFFCQLNFICKESNIKPKYIRIGVKTGRICLDAQWTLIDPSVPDTFCTHESNLGASKQLSLIKVELVRPLDLKMQMVPSKSL